jgi:hypothetical protein
MSDHESYNFDTAIRTCREAMKKTDLTTFATIALARSVAAHLRHEFPVDQQEAAARALILATGCIGGQLVSMPVHTPAGQKYLAAAMLNVQACAAVMVLDQLEIEHLEASLKVEP